MDTRDFYMLIPLSNWILGFDRYGGVYDKAHIEQSRYPGQTYLIESLDQVETNTVLDKTHRLIEKIGIPGDRVVVIRTRLGTDAGQKGQAVASPNTYTGTGVGWMWPSSRVPVEQVGWLEAGEFIPVPHETITAQAFALEYNNLARWDQCAPRSFSVLPIAQACNARCAFCFSKASLSDSVIPGRIDLAGIDYWARRAAEKGAGRAVITGGGEATLLSQSVLLELMETLGRHFPYTLLITNGSKIERWIDREGFDRAVENVQQWRQAGLSRIAISRHGVDLESDARIMGLRVDTPRVIEVARQAGIPTRIICVVQKGGVQTAQDIENFLHRAAQDGADQVCFKELYVSSLSENPWASSRENIYCQANQVPLSMVVQALEGMGFEKTSTLPWGSPCYEGRVGDRMLKAAAYTEPSVGWERKNKIARSWNLFSDGKCAASLEDPASILEGK